jgi:hypothetical protein
MSRRLGLLLVAGLVAAGSLVAVVLARDDGPLAKTIPNHAFGSLTGAKDPISVWAIGDGAAGTPASRALGRQIARTDPDRVLYLGDVYESGTPEEFKTRFDTAYGALLDRMLPTPGNHEWPQRAEGYNPYWKGVTHAPTPPWYAVQLGDWQVLSLNSEADHGAGSPQVRFLDRQLTKPAPCRLAFWHRPRYSAGTHGDQDDMAPVWDRLAGRATLVLGGHDHDLQRFKPIHGTTELVDGAGGRDRYPVDGSDTRLAFSDDSQFGAVKLALHPTGADVRFVGLGGKVIDRSTVTC